MKKFTVYYDQRLEVELRAENEDEAKEMARELINVEVSVQGDQVKVDGLAFADIEEESIELEEDDDPNELLAYYENKEGK